MSILSDIRQLTLADKRVILASYLGWTLDAFDFFILIFVLRDIAHEFGTSIESVTLAITLTLAMRPLGAFIFGLFADRFGRRPAMMVNILFYSALEFASGFAPSLTVLIILRALYGIAMGGEWGVATALALESVPAKVRGTVSGILQSGYPSGYLLASVVYFFLYPLIGWRGMFMVGVLPALLVFYIRRHIKESPAFIEQRHSRTSQKMRFSFGGHAKIFIWAILMMTAFNFFSHGTQDLYPTFLQQQRHLSSYSVSMIAVIYNIGAIMGGLFFGNLSNRIGRRKAIMIASLLVLPIIPLWTNANTSVGLAFGAFLVQFFVQGAWGVIPAHLSEISPPEYRSTFPGVAYQLGNLLASCNAPLQALIATAHGGDYALSLGLITGIVAVGLALISGFGYEAKDRRFVQNQDTLPD